jgi:hypothetical protein
VKKSLQVLHRALRARASATQEAARRPAASLSIPQDLIERSMSESKWWDLREIAEHFRISHDTAARCFVGRPGVQKVGKVYRVPDFVVREWVEAALARNLEGA